jgi:hypothetical protein
MAERRSAAALAFLAMAFVIVGLAGIFASFAAPLPLHRALLRDAALDAASEAARAPDPQAALAALAPRLGDSAAALAVGDPGKLPERIQAERTAMRARFLAEADVLGLRLRVLIGVLTLAAGGFGLAMAGARGQR